MTYTRDASGSCATCHIQSTPHTLSIPRLIGIFASSINDCIGYNNRLPWHIPQDLAFFRQQTKGHIIVMGRKTFESLPNGGLPNRIHIVISNNPPPYNPYTFPNIHLCTMEYLNDMIKHLTLEHPEKKVFVIGGASIFQQLANQIDVFLVTHVKKHVEGDVFFRIDETRYPHTTILNHQYDPHEDCFVEWVRYAIAPPSTTTSNIL